MKPASGLGPQTVVGEVWVGKLGARVEVSAGEVVSVDLLPMGGKAARYKAPKNATLKRAALEVKEYLAGRRKKFTVPFSQRQATPFHARVYEALAKVPYGRVITYGELAASAGNPRAARAVGSAMNRNRIPLIVPCHRVVASNGMGGFGCGVEWKRALLDLERSDRL